MSFTKKCAFVHLPNDIPIIPVYHSMQLDLIWDLLKPKIWNLQLFYQHSKVQGVAYLVVMILCVKKHSFPSPRKRAEQDDYRIGFSRGRVIWWVSVLMAFNVSPWNCSCSNSSFFLFSHFFFFWWHGKHVGSTYKCVFFSHCSWTEHLLSLMLSLCNS